MWDKIGAEGGDAPCQNQLGWMYQHGEGMGSPDYKQARVWYEKAAAQDFPLACAQLGYMAFNLGLPPSWRRARECTQRRSELTARGAQEEQLEGRAPSSERCNLHEGKHHAPRRPFLHIVVIRFKRCANGRRNPASQEKDGHGA